MNRRADRRQRGQASLEFLALLPLVLLAGLLALQGAAAMWVMNSTSEAARTAARAYSLGQNPQAAAAGSLPGGLTVHDLQLVGPDHGVKLTVGVPRVAPIPALYVTRTVELP